MLKTVAIGNLGNDCIVRVHNGKTAISFSIAHNEKYKNSSGVDKENTIWINCTYWRENDKIAEYLKKGQQVYVEGMPSVKMYDNQEGKPAVAFGLTVFKIELLGSSRKQETVKVAVAAQNGTSMENARPDTEAPIPFDQ